MRELFDYEGRRIRLSDERYTHILEHREMTGMPGTIGEVRSLAMTERKLTVWYDPEGDHLEGIFDQRPGFFRETDNEQGMQKVDEAGNVLGFSVLRVSALKETPLEISL